MQSTSPDQQISTMDNQVSTIEKQITPNHKEKRYNDKQISTNGKQKISKDKSKKSNNEKKIPKEKSPRAQKRNEVQQNYLTPKTNHVVCIDSTTLHKGEGTHIVYGMDLASRNIIGHCFTDQPVNVSMISDTLTKAFNGRSFLSKVCILHSDREPLYKNIPYEEVLKDYDIELSVGSAKGHHHQVIERSFSTLKQYMRKDLGIPTGSDISLKHLKTFQDKAAYVMKMIEFYNNHTHQALYGLTPSF